MVATATETVSYMCLVVFACHRWLLARIRPVLGGIGMRRNLKSKLSFLAIMWVLRFLGRQPLLGCDCNRNCRFVHLIVFAYHQWLLARMRPELGGIGMRRNLDSKVFFLAIVWVFRFLGRQPLLGRDCDRNCRFMHLIAFAYHQWPLTRMRSALGGISMR